MNKKRIEPIDFEIYSLYKQKLKYTEIAKFLCIRPIKVSIRMARIKRWMKPENEFYRDVSCRLANCLIQVGITLKSREDLKLISKKDISFFDGIRNFGHSSLNELNNLLENHGFKRLRPKICKSCGREFKSFV